MDEEPIQDAETIAAIAMLAKQLAEEDKQQRLAIASEAEVIPEAESVLSGNEPPAVKEAAEDKPNVLEQAIGVVPELQQAVTPEMVPIPKSEQTASPDMSDWDLQNPEPLYMWNRPGGPGWERVEAWQRARETELQKRKDEEAPTAAASPTPVPALEAPPAAASPAPIPALEAPPADVSPAPIPALEAPPADVSPAQVKPPEPPQPAVSPKPDFTPAAISENKIDDSDLEWIFDFPPQPADSGQIEARPEERLAIGRPESAAIEIPAQSAASEAAVVFEPVATPVSQNPAEPESMTQSSVASQNQAAFQPPEQVAASGQIPTLEAQPAAVSPAPVPALEAPPTAATSAPMAAPAPVIQPPAAPVPPTPAVLENAPGQSVAAEALDLNLELQNEASPEPISFDVFEGQRNTAEQPQAINYDQGVTTPESAFVSDVEYSQPAVQQFNDPTVDINQQLQQAAERPRDVAQQIEDLQQAHRRFLDLHAGAIESLRATPQHLWSPEQKQQARQIRQAKEVYQDRILDLGAEPPPPPRPPAFGSERPIETENLFAAQRPAAQPLTWATPEGVPTRQPAEQAWLQAAVEAATPAEFVTGPPQPESPPQIALTEFPENSPEASRGNLASDALADTTWSEATWFERAEATAAPESGLPVHGPEAPPVATPPGTIWERMGRMARQAISPPVPTSEKARKTIREREARRHEEALETMRRDDPAAWAAFAPDEEEEPLSSVPDDDDFWSALPAVGSRRQRGGGGRRQGGGSTSDATPPDNILHVWVDGGKLQEVERIGSLGQSGGGSQGDGQGLGEQNSGSNQGSTWSDWLSMQSLPAIGRYVLQQGASTAASATSPFIGDANASVLGGAGESLGGALAGGMTLGAGLATGTPMFVAQGMAMLGKELITLPKNVASWSEALIQSQFSLKEWSSSVAQIAVKSEVRDILRGQASGEATKETLEKMSMEWQQFKDAWRPLKDWVTNELNKKSEDLAYRFRPFTGGEKEVLEAKERGGEDREEYLRWLKERGGGGTKSENERKWLEKQREEHPERFEEENRATYSLFEGWMRDWQDGKFMEPRSNRPVPVAP